MTAVALTPDISWVGAVDWSLREFHGFTTSRGTSYNAYLIQDEKTALIDAVKEPHFEVLRQHLAELKAEPDFIVCNHAEPDHSGALPQVLQLFPQAKLLCTSKCQKVLEKHYNLDDWPIQLVSPEERVSLGRRTLQFIETPMVHWPDSTFTYVPEEQILFSMDAFGQHLATAQRFNDQVDPAALEEELRSYYANIIMPLGKFVLQTMDQLPGLPLKIIAPSHGVAWRSDFSSLFARYRSWARGGLTAKVVVLYDSMWGSTAQMAQAIAAGAASRQVAVKLLDLRHTSLTEIAAESLEAAAFALGSSTLNQGPLPAVAGALSYLKGLKPQGRTAFAFGSYGWEKGGIKWLDQMITELKWERLQVPLSSQYRPSEEVLAECRRAGELLADKAKAMATEEWEA